MAVNQFTERDEAPKRPHRLVLDDRHLLTVSGVTDVDNFDESKIEARTEQGRMIIEGDGLHIVRLMVESGELVVEGLIGGVAYLTQGPESGGFFARLLK